MPVRITAEAILSKDAARAREAKAARGGKAGQPDVWHPDVAVLAWSACPTIAGPGSAPR